MFTQPLYDLFVKWPNWGRIMRLTPGYAYRGGIATSSVYKNTTLLYLELSTAFNMKTH